MHKYLEDMEIVLKQSAEPAVDRTYLNLRHKKEKNQAVFTFLCTPGDINEWFWFILLGKTLKEYPKSCSDPFTFNVRRNVASLPPWKS